MKKRILFLFLSVVWINFMFNSCEYGDEHFDVLLPISEVRNHYGIFFSETVAESSRNL